jgi:acetyl esterase
MATSFNWSDILDRAGLADPFAPDTSRRAGRAAFRKLVPIMESSAPPVSDVNDLSVPGPAGEIPARLYTPDHALDAMTVFYHGGGYAFGDLESHHRVAQRLCAGSRSRVLAVDYRLAPEHPFPAAWEDAIAALDWAASEAPGKLAVAGDSAGGGLAACVAQARRDKIDFQLLIYPLLQLAETRKVKPKMLQGHMLSARALDWIREAYCGDCDPMDPRLSPLFADDLAGLPAAYIAAAELDPLLDEGRAYRDRLLAAGVAVDYRLAKGLPHGFFNLTRVARGAEAQCDAAAAALHRALSS